MIWVDSFVRDFVGGRLTAQVISSSREGRLKRSPREPTATTCGELKGHLFATICMVRKSNSVAQADAVRAGVELFAKRQWVELRRHGCVELLTDAIAPKRLGR
jgi:hypothetical protein